MSSSDLFRRRQEGQEGFVEEFKTRKSLLRASGQQFTSEKRDPRLAVAYL
jgi:hypothetical protein